MSAAGAAAGVLSAPSRRAAAATSDGPRAAGRRGGARGGGGGGAARRPMQQQREAKAIGAEKDDGGAGETGATAAAAAPDAAAAAVAPAVAVSPKARTAVRPVAVAASPRADAGALAAAGAGAAAGAAAAKAKVAKPAGARDVAGAGAGGAKLPGAGAAAVNKSRAAGPPRKLNTVRYPPPIVNRVAAGIRLLGVVRPERLPGPVVAAPDALIARLLNTLKWVCEQPPRAVIVPAPLPADPQAAKAVQREARVFFVHCCRTLQPQQQVGIEPEPIPWTAGSGGSTSRAVAACALDVCIRHGLVLDVTGAESARWAGLLQRDANDPYGCDFRTDTNPFLVACASPAPHAMAQAILDLPQATLTPAVSATVFGATTVMGFYKCTPLLAALNKWNRLPEWSQHIGSHVVPTVTLWPRQHAWLDVELCLRLVDRMDDDTALNLTLPDGGNVVPADQPSYSRPGVKIGDKGRDVTALGLAIAGAARVYPLTPRYHWLPQPPPTAAAEEALSFARVALALLAHAADDGSGVHVPPNPPDLSAARSPPAAAAPAAGAGAGAAAAARRNCRGGEDDDAAETAPPIDMLHEAELLQAWQHARASEAALTGDAAPQTVPAVSDPAKNDFKAGAGGLSLAAADGGLWDEQVVPPRPPTRSRMLRSILDALVRVRTRRVQYRLLFERELIAALHPTASAGASAQASGLPVADLIRVVASYLLPLPKEMPKSSS